MKSNNAKLAKRGIIVAVLLLGLVVGAMSAYFTDTDSETNKFVYGKIDIDLTEPNWNEENAKDLVPNQTVAKDPTVTNIGVNDAFIFTTVEIPYANVVTAKDNGELKTQAWTALFTYNDADQDGVPSPNTGWVQVGNADVDEAAGTITYTYAWVGTEGDGSTMAAVAATEKTGTVFDTIKATNVIEGQSLETTEKNIVVKAYGIQSTNINGGQTAPADVWAVVSTQNEVA